MDTRRDAPTFAADAATGILTARPPHSEQLPAAGPQSRGRVALGLDGRRDGLLCIPRSYSPDRPAPLILLLHGAGGSARGILPALEAEAEAQGIVLLAPDSRGRTWDVILDDYGPDVTFIDRALQRVFGSLSIAPERVAVAGFSDGASYALSLGLINGGLFTHVLGFSPGFMAPTRSEGAPAFFVAHGIDDRVLPVERCSRPLVARLEAAGYRVRYREFAGGHIIPPDVARDAVVWFLGAGDRRRNVPGGDG